MRSKSTIETYNTLCDKLRNNDRVFYSRFGDGDIYIMDGRAEAMHSWSENLQKELKEAIKIEDENYLRGVAVNYVKEEGMYSNVFEPHGTNTYLSNFLSNELGFEEDYTFESAIMPHYMSVFKQNEMVDFLNEFIRPKKKLFIGSISKEDAAKLLGHIDYYVNVPHRDAYTSMESWYDEAMQVIDDVELVIPTAGMATRVFNKRLWNKGTKVHSIDIGSVIDAVGNSNTRAWIDLEGHKINNILV